MHNYFVLNRVYDSILKLNPVIKKYGFVFEAYNSSEFFSKFDRIISFGSELRDRTGLYRLFSIGPMFDLNVGDKLPMVLLKSINSYRIIRMETNQEVSTIQKNQKAFVNKLVTVLRLYKNGMMEETMEFQYDINTKKWGSIGINKMRKNFIADEYTIDDNDVEKIALLLSKDIKIKPLSKLAFESFNEYYSIEQMSLKYVTLMTALESVFNKGKDQIAHTCSRHLAILLSDNVDSFNENYKNMKSLYNYRSKIVHGENYKKLELEKKILQLENYVRNVLNIILFKDCSKDELFMELNSKGF